MAHWRRFLKFCPCIFTICNYLPLEMVMELYLEILESPSSENALYQVWVTLTQCFWRRWMWQRQQQRTDKFQSENLIEPWAQKSWKIKTFLILKGLLFTFIKMSFMIHDRIDTSWLFNICCLSSCNFWVSFSQMERSTFRTLPELPNFIELN